MAMSTRPRGPSNARRQTACPDCRHWQRQARQAERRVQRLSRDNDKLRERVRTLEEQLEQAQRSAKRQAAPFSRGRPKGKPRRPGRRRGAAYGPRARRPVPDHVDETVEVPLPCGCPDCGGDVELDRIADQYQTEIPPVRPHVTRFRVHLGHCRRCYKKLRGRHPRQVSQALGAAAPHLGPRAVALAADLNKRLGLSYGKVVALFQAAFGLTVSRGGVCQALARLARAAEPTYRGLIERVRGSPVVAPDETGWKVGGRLNWLWVFVSAEVTVYAIQPGRGFDQAAAILSAEFSGVLERDGWAPYRRFEQAEHQTCLDHLLRRCRHLLDWAERGQARFPHAVRRVLLAALDLRERFAAGQLSPHGLAVARGRLAARMDRTLTGRITHPPNLRFARHLSREQPYLFTFLGRDDVAATNHRAEQAIRPAVVTRKVWGGNRTWAGAHTQQILASVLRTCHQQGRDPLGLFALMLHWQRPPNLAPMMLNPTGRH
ncbi:MAG: IS66 family transposase [Anaerolineae bacterium]